MSSPREIGLDSQCLSFVIDAFEGVSQPADSLAAQKIALARLYFYTAGTLWVTPTVERELAPIKELTRRASHQSWTSVIFGPYPVNDSRAVKRRRTYLHQFHAKTGDCQILAEAEDIGLAALLSFDCKFLKRLGPHAYLKLTTPAQQLWEDLAIPKGATPNKEPSFDNPLSGERWWRW